MANKIINPPSSGVMMNSIRSIGYSFKTALADVIDNSISANASNVWIMSPVDDTTEMYVTILDDGYGMLDSEIYNAMTYGSIRKNGYSKDELGRFGLGLKSASSSQCRKFTCVSKKDGKINAYQWDLDVVLEDDEWNCLKLNKNEIEKLPEISSLQLLETGTLVIWENFDVAYKKSNGQIRKYMIDEIDEADEHLRLVFHRFLNKKRNKVNIYINNVKLVGFDPFLENHNKLDPIQYKPLNCKGSEINVTAYVLPHQNDLTAEDIEKVGGIDALRKGQGFYIYRNERLIQSGTWFKLNPQNANMTSELYKYGRIKVDIPNTLDDIWEIDIKKQNAVIPKEILNYLKTVVKKTCDNSERKTAKRVKLTYDVDKTKIWNKMLSRGNTGKDCFYINTESEFMKKFLEEFDDYDRVKISKLLDVVSSTLPFDDIYNSVCNKNNETVLDDEQLNTIVLEGVSQIKRYQNQLKCTQEKAFELVTKYEPFNDENVAKFIKEKLQ